MHLTAPKLDSMRIVPASLVPALFVLLWSTGFIGAKYGLPYAEPFTFLLIRFAVVIPVLATAAVATSAPWPRRPADLGRLAFVGILLHGFYLWGVFFAIKTGVPAGVAALIVGLQPLLTAALGRLYLHERLSRTGWIGLALGLAGVGFVVGPSIDFSHASVGGFAAAFVALLAITAATLYQKRHGSGMNLITGSAVQFAAAALAVLPVAALFEHWRIEWNGSFVFAVLWLALVLSIGAISLLHLLIRRGAATRVASLFYLTPSVTAVLAYFLFGERLNMFTITGFVLAALGVALVTRR
nr:DMT family transporter [Defluviicoccus vanus]